MATNFYEDAAKGNNPDVSPETANHWLKDLAFQREKIQEAKPTLDE